MGVYRVTVRDAAGETRATTVQAADPTAAARAMQARGLFVSQVDLAPRVATGDAVGGLHARVFPVSADALALFFRHLAALTKVGQTPAAALASMASRMTDRRLAAFANRASARCADGEPLSAAVCLEPVLFPQWVAAMVAVAEQSGRPNEILGHIRSELDDEARLAARFRLPRVYLRVAAALAALLLSSGTLVSGGVLPWLRGVLTVYLPALAVLQAMVWTGRAFVRHPSMRDLRESLIARVPGAGALQRERGLLRFARSIRALNRAGRSVPEAFALAVPVAAQRPLVAGLERGAAALIQGASLAQAFQATGLFDGHLVRLVAEGERTGRVDQIVSGLCQEQERRVATAQRTTFYVIWGALIALSLLVIGAGAVGGLVSLMAGLMRKILEFINTF